MHLSPETDASKLVKDKLPPLPSLRSIVDIIADFLRYLFQCASSYIKGAHANGEDLWSSVKDEITFVLTHPNGWEKFQQSQMQQAAFLSGLITDDEEGYDRILFLTEGEASLHFAIQNGLSMEVKLVLPQSHSTHLTPFFREAMALSLLMLAEVPST